MFSRSAKNDTKCISILDFDDTLATTKSKVLFTAPDGTTGSLNAEQYASQYQDLAEQGYKFDFSEFNIVVGGETAPLFNKALKLAKKFGVTQQTIARWEKGLTEPSIKQLRQLSEHFLTLLVGQQ